VSAVVAVLRALVREELAQQRSAELGIVTQVFANEDGSGDNNLELNVRVRGSATELQRVPLLVGRPGMTYAPREGDLVLLAFVGGDLNAPVAVGFLYDEQTTPPKGSAAEIVYEVPDDEDDDARRLQIKLASGNTVTIQDKKVEIVMGSTKIHVEADGAITLEAGGDISLKASGDLKLEATGTASLKGSSVSVKADADATLKGSTTTIAGNTSFSAQ
jgi:hypothetical protein